MARSRSVRFVAVWAAVAPLSSGLLLATAPAASAADSDFSAPAVGQDFTGPAKAVSVVATVPACPKNALGQCSSRPTTTLTASSSAQGQTLTDSKAATGSTQSISITVPASAANASWTATLSGGTTGTRRFTTSFQAASPAGFDATGSGAREVVFRWTKGSEPDLSGYTLSDDAGTMLADIDAAASCSGSNCDYSLYYPSDNPGTHTYSLVAKRPGGAGGTVASEPATSSATLVKPPPPAPSPTPGPSAPSGGTTGGSTSGSTGGTTGGTSTGGTSAGGTSGGSTGGTSGGATGGSATSGSGSTGSGGTGSPNVTPTLPSFSNPLLTQRRSFALNFNAFSPSLGIPKLPPLPATLPSLAAGEAPLPDGTFAPTLDYGDRTETDKTTTVLSTPIRSVKNVLDSEQLAKSIAAALVLLLIGAHLRRFLSTHLED